VTFKGWKKSAWPFFLIASLSSLLQFYRVAFFLLGIAWRFCCEENGSGGNSPGVLEER